MGLVYWTPFGCQVYCRDLKPCDQGKAKTLNTKTRTFGLKTRAMTIGTKTLDLRTKTLKNHFEKSQSHSIPY